MKHRGTKILSLLLTLALMLGLIPGMSLTAYADPSVAISPSGAGTVAVTTTEGKPAKYVLTATPAAGYRFSKWTWLDHNNEADSTTNHPVNLFKRLVDDGYHNNITAVFELLVTGVTLNPNAAQTITVGDKVSFTASVQPDGVTDKKVKWSVDGSAVTLYTDVTCNTPVTLNTATDTLTVYAKGMSEDNATVTVTSNADSTKSASCAVTVIAAGYTVTYFADNGKGQTVGPNTMTMPYTVEGNMFDVPDGKKFVDWLVKGTTTHYTDGTIINSVSGNLELVAQWESVNNGGNQDGGDVVFYGSFGGSDGWSGGYVTGQRAWRVSLAPDAGRQRGACAEHRREHERLPADHRPGRTQPRPRL